jgi:hypothetical protein
MDAPRDEVSSALASALSPLISAYAAQLAAARASQTSLQAKLSAVLQELRASQASADDGEVAKMGAAAARVEALRRRLEGVAGLMGKVSARLEGLQGAVTRKEAEAAAAAKRAAPSS